MNEKLEMAKNSLYNANEIKDIKENPVVESVLLASIKAIPVLGDLIDSSTNKLLNDFQQKKEQEFFAISNFSFIIVLPFSSQQLFYPK